MSVTDKFHVGAQLYLRNIGPLGKWRPDLDWAYAGYKSKNWLGVRGGKVKTALGLYNDTRTLNFFGRGHSCRNRCIHWTPRKEHCARGWRDIRIDSYREVGQVQPHRIRRRSNLRSERWVLLFFARSRYSDYQRFGPRRRWRSAMGIRHWEGPDVRRFVYGSSEKGWFLSAAYRVSKHLWNWEPITPVITRAIPLRPIRTPTTFTSLRRSSISLITGTSKVKVTSWTATAPFTRRTASIPETIRTV